MTSGHLRAVGAWNSSANYDSDNPVWDAWGGSGQSLSGWVSDPGSRHGPLPPPVTVANGRRHVQNGVVILRNEAAPRGSVNESLDKDSKVLHTATFT